MSRPITWQNVSGPNMSGISAMMDQAIENVTAGIGGHRERQLENAEEQRLANQHIAEMLMAEADLEGQRFKNANAGRVLDSEISSRTAHADAARFATGAKQDTLAYAAQMQKITDAVPRNEDGSLNRKEIRRIAAEQLIPSADIDAGMDMSNRVSGFDDVLSARALADRDKHAKDLKKLGRSKSGSSDVYTGFEDAPWWGEGQNAADIFSAEISGKDYTQAEKKYIMAKGTVERSLFSFGPKEFSTAKAKAAEIEVQEKRAKEALRKKP